MLWRGKKNGQRRKSLLGRFVKSKDGVTAIEFAMVGGGIASYSTKSGTNEFHGSAFEYNQINTPGFKTVAAGS